MSSRQWIRVAACDQIPPREGRAVSIGGEELAIFNLGPAERGADDRFLAIEGRCPHQGGPLADGIVSGDAVICPLHAWKVSLVSGDVKRPANAGACVRTYPTRVAEGIVMIEWPETREARNAGVTPAMHECTGG